MSTMMSQAFFAVCLSGVLGALAPACTVSQGPDGGDASPAPALVASRTPPRVVSAPAQRQLAADLAAVPLLARAGDPALGPVGQRAAQTGDGRLLLALLVRCALPEGQVVTATPVGPGAGPVEFFGSVGLAPGWATGQFDPASRRWVSGCALAQLSGTDSAVAVSLRGRRPELTPSADEAAGWSLEEGAFFGDVFADPARPLPWFACAGTAPVDAGVLLDRVCAQEDPARPGVTRCGMTYVGTCAGVCDPAGAGLFRACRTPTGGYAGRAEEVVVVFLAP